MQSIFRLPALSLSRSSLVATAGLLLALSSIAAPAAAHDARVGRLHISHPAAPATLPGQTSGAIYLGIENEGKEADRLLSASSPAAAGVAIHRMSMTDNIMRMREIDNLALPAGGKVVIDAESGLHLMLTGLKQPLKAGDKVPLSLRFERAGTIEVRVHVEQNVARANTTNQAHGTHAH